MRPAGQEMIAIEKIICYCSQERRACLPHRAPRGSTGVTHEVEGAQGKHGHKTCGFWGKGLEFANLNNLSGFWDLGWCVVVWYLGPGMIRAEGCRVLECKSQIGVLFWSMDYGLVD